ncbi:hypothetical protein CYFUS_008800 [Cystobacter fuscus]|uniref:Uncharacterized protein n=1 Tax=Cystobacter fuscus TaxID=43 RepID=A0A250JI70_9BACT|nr:hypothetical protein [Cystobacter fuscus]ATB43320.1 hypothetical protein CYFUS_008800 [Cystobacter fuscus]
MKITRSLSLAALAVTLASTPALADGANCTPNQVAVFANRIHVRCTASTAGGIYFFALSTSDSAFANRTLSLFSTALAGGRPVYIDYNPSSTSGVSLGCLSSDCRLINWAAIY